MEKFIRFKEKVYLEDLRKVLADSRIILLRESQTTETIQIQVLSNITEKEIRLAFVPYQIQKIYDEFPYPFKHRRLAAFSFGSLLQILKNLFRKRSQK